MQAGCTVRERGGLGRADQGNRVRLSEGAWRSIYPIQRSTAQWARTSNEWLGRAASPDRGISMKRTYQPSKVRRARTHGFLVRMKTRGGRAVISARRGKGRKRLGL